MLHFLTGLTYWHWLGLGILLLILELLFASGGFLLWIAIAAGIAGVLAWLFPALEWPYQFLIFAIGAVFSCVLWRWYLRHHPTRSDAPTLNRRGQQYIGRTFILETPILNGRGTIRVDDTTWRVAGNDLPKGASVRVIAVDSVILQVEPVE